MRFFNVNAALAIAMITGGTILAKDPPILAPKTILNGHTQAVWCMALSRDGKLLASGAGNLKVDANNSGELMLWSPATGNRLATLPSQGGRVRSLAFAPDGKIIAAAYEPENVIGRARVVLWSLSSKIPLAKTPFEAVSLAFSSDGKLLAMGGIEPDPPFPQGGGRRGGAIQVWDVKR